MLTQTTFEGIPDEAQKHVSAEKPAQIGATERPASAGRLPEWAVGLRALSIRQPWATSIVHFGKPVENRVWNGGYLKAQLSGIREGDRFLIHAAKNMEEDDILGWRELIEDCPSCRPTSAMLAAAGVKTYADLPRGGIIGAATYAGWVKDHSSQWFVGPGAVVMADVLPLPFVPCRGMLGFFRPVFE